MSLINQMLKDLDARHEGDTRGRLHREVRALPEIKKNQAPRLTIIALLTLALAAAAWWGLESFERVDRHAEVNAGHPAISATPVPVASESSVVAASALSATVSAIPKDPAAPLPVAAAIATPTSTAPVSPPAVAVPVAAEAAPLAAENALKLSAMLDKVPEAEVVAPKSPPVTPVVKASSPPASTHKREPSPTVTVAASSQLAPRIVTPSSNGKPTASGAVDKTPVARTARERSEIAYRQAVALVNGSRVSEATDVLLDVLQLDGGHVASRQLLARLLIEQRRNDEAMAILVEGLASQPGQIAWAMTLARLQVDRGDFAGAARSLQQSQSFASGNADYQGFAGHVQLRLGRHKESIDFYQAAVRLAPSEGRWWLGLGLALEADHRQAESREAFQRARASGTLNADLLSVVDQKLR